MQIVINKVKNGYVCTMNGEMYVYNQLTQVVAFLVNQFDDCVITRLLDELTYPPKDNEPITSNSEQV